MDIEFHYYMTYLIAARAGFLPKDAETLARASQSVDDNHILYRVTGAATGTYKNYILRIRATIHSRSIKA